MCMRRARGWPGWSWRPVRCGRGGCVVLRRGLRRSLRSSDARLIYEAGPTGFGLARAGVELGVEVVVCAPGSVPRAAGDRVKTDRRDAERLLRLWRAGELSLVRVPSP